MEGKMTYYTDIPNEDIRAAIREGLENLLALEFTSLMGVDVEARLSEGGLGFIEETRRSMAGKLAAEFFDRFFAERLQDGSLDFMAEKGNTGDTRAAIATNCIQIVTLAEPLIRWKYSNYLNQGTER